MKLIRYLSFLLMLVLGSALPSGHTAAQSTPQDAALQFIRSTGVGLNFPQLIARVTSNTQTFSSLAAKHGETEVMDVLMEKTVETVGKHGRQWESNLADAYLEFFTPEQLTSLRTLKADSPYNKALDQKRNDIGRAMQGRSTDLLKTAARETAMALAEHYEKPQAK